MTGPDAAAAFTGRRPLRAWAEQSPPDFAKPVPAHVGRHGTALCVFERSGERTILRDAFSRVPLQVLRPLYPEGGDPAHLTLVNPTGGHVGGDCLHAEVALGRNARVLWTTQGATKVYRSLGEPVVSTMTIEMEAGSALEVVPDPVIPYADSIYRQTVDVKLHETAKLLYGEMLYPGRTASGELFDYTQVALRFRARMGDAPLLADAMEVRPRSSGDASDPTGSGLSEPQVADRATWTARDRPGPARLGLFEPHPYLGSFYVLGGAEEALEEAAAQADALLNETDGVVGGASLLEGPGAIVRWLAATPVLLKRTFDDVWAIARTVQLGLSPVRLRKL